MFRILIYVFLLFLLAFFYLQYRKVSSHNASVSSEDRALPKFTPLDKVFTIFHIILLFVGIIGIFISIWLKTILRNYGVTVNLYKDELNITITLIVIISIFCLVKGSFYLTSYNRFKRFILSILEEDEGKD